MVLMRARFNTALFLFGLMHHQALIQVLRTVAGVTLLVLTAAPAARAQATITVNSTAQEVTLANPNGIVNGNCTLGEAIIAANTNAAVDACTAGQSGGTDTVIIPAGTYTLTGAARNAPIFNNPIGLPNIAEDVVLQGSGATTTILEGTRVAGTPAFAMTAAFAGSVAFESLTIRDFLTTCGMGGAAIMRFTVPITLNNSIVEGNLSDADCGGGEASFSEVFNAAAPFVANNTLFRNNTAQFTGAVVLYASGPVTITNSTFLNNSGALAGSSAGAMHVGGDGPINITNSLFSGNNANGPGAVLRMSSLPNCGPACGVNPVVNITRSYFLNNSTPPNGSSGSSGAVLSSSGQNLTMTITASTFSDNEAGSNIGGVLHFDGNTGTVTIENSTFSGNRAATFGTAIYARGNTPGLALTLNNVTMTDNFGTFFNNGAALFLDQTATATLRNTVIARNTINGSVCDLRTQSGGLFISQGNNMFGHTACANFSVTDPSDQMWSQQWPFHPVLIPLADNGGPQAGSNVGGVAPVTIPTRGLFTGSPLIDLGSALAPGSGGTSCLATDQRGLPRPGGARCDVGAFEDQTAAGVIAVFDLAVTKTDTPDPVNVGNNLTYTITVTNNGTDPAPNVVVTDPLPAGVTFVSALAENDPFSTCNFAAGTVTCNIGTIAQGDSLDVTIVVTVTGAASSPLLNTASASATGTEAVPGNNSGTASTTIAGLSADLSVTKSDSPDPINLGAGNISYTIAVTNNGPGAATNALLSDPLPAGVNFASLTAAAGWTCSTPAVGATGTVSCTNPSVAANSTHNFTLAVTPTAAATVNNTATVASATADSNAANNSATAATTVNPSADVSVAVTDAPDPVNAGANMTYTVTVANAGPSPATAVMLTNTLPAGVNFVTSTPSAGTCNAPAAGSFTCNLGTINSGVNATVAAVVQTTGATAASITNSATVSAAEFDPTAANNTASAATTVTPVADLGATITDAPDPATQGGNITYTVTVTNAGPSSATGVTVTAPVPANVTFVSGTATQGTCTLAAGIITCAIGNMASGASVAATVIVTTTAAGTVNASVSVTSPVLDPTPANNSASATTTVNAASGSGFTLASAAPAQTVFAGQAATFTINVMPSGGSYTNPVTLAATGLPNGATGAFNPGSVTPGTAGASSTLTIAVPFRAAAPPLSLPRNVPPSAPMWFAGLLACALAILPAAAYARRAGWQHAGRLRTAALLLLLALVAGATVACGGGGFPLTNVSGTYTITITGTSGAIQQSTTVTLTVQ